MPWALFGLGVVFVALALHARAPLRRPGLLVLPAWFASWPFSELPLHVAAAVCATAGALAYAGGLESWPGVAGLGLCVVGVAGQWQQHGRARRARADLERALGRALGDGDDAPGEPAQGAPGGVRSRWRMVRLLPIRSRAVERIRDVVYHRVGRRALRLDLYRRRGQPTGCPVLLYVHGGGWVIGNKAQQGLVTVDHLAARGWLCVSIDYRLSPAATFPDHLIDVKRAIRWVREHAAAYGGDPSCVVLAGASAGAHLVSLAALTPNAVEYQRDFAETDTTVQGCVALYGVYDFTDRHAHWEHAMFRWLLERVVMKRRLSAARPEFEKASPVCCAAACATPFLLIHGDRDNLAPVAESRRFAEVLRDASCAPVAYAELPGAAHAFDLLPTPRSVGVVEGIERFCARIERDRRSAGAPAAARI